ncbi:hypothetical protein [Blastococcus atacamensis]|uniref:hypothetical protein n=1 Tax=Blastococcus atacamensis TaxID=2070508 RepID=UPI000CECBCD3|nr:hypothetical protein [Blastococcus atacamensis]
MTVIPLPRHGQWVGDLRGQGRSVRVSAHADVGVTSLSLWRGDTCVGTAQLLPAEVALLIGGLSDGLAEIAVQPARQPSGARLRALEDRLAGLESRLGARPGATDQLLAAGRSARTAVRNWWNGIR